MRGRRYDVGDSVRLDGVFSDPDSGDPVDPPVVRLLVRSPVGDDEIFEYPGELVRLAPGLYRRIVFVGRAGVWTYRFESEGPTRAAAEQTFRVRSTAFI